MNTLDAICRFVLVVLINAAWQVTVVGLLTLVVLRVGRIRSPQWRSGVCIAALLAILACPVLTTLSQRAGVHLSGLTWESAIPAVTPLPLTMRATRPQVSVAAPRADEPMADLAPIAPAPGEGLAVKETPKVEGRASMSLAAMWARVNPLHGLVAAYGLGVLLLLGRLAAGEAYLQYLRAAASPSLERMEGMLQRLAQQSHLRQRVRIGVSVRVATPVLVGTLQPMILMPADLADLPDAHLEVILLHEIAHVRRLDTVFNLLQRLAEAVLFFHPVIWLVGRELRLQRERCCDAWVVEQTGRELDYARCLTDLAERLTSNWKAMPRVAMAEFRHELPRRIVAVLDGSARTARNLPRWARNLAIVTALVSAGAVSVCGLTLADQKPGSDKSAASQPAGTQPAAANQDKTAVPPVEPWQRETGTVDVKVLDENGKPVAGVKIEPNGLRLKADASGHYAWGSATAIPATAVLTNAEGIATVTYPKYISEKIEVGYITFSATHPDYAPANSYKYAVDGGDKMVLKKGATLKVSGYVGAKGNTVPVKVQVTDVEATLGEDAWQDLPNNVRMTQQLAPGKHYVRLIHLPQDGPAQFSEAVVLEAEAGKQYTLDLAIQPGVRVEGQLDASVPRPVRHGWIIAEAGPPGPDAEKGMMAWLEWTRTAPHWRTEVPIAENGTFVLSSLPAGQLQLIGLCEGFLSRDPSQAQSPGTVNPQSFPISGRSAQVELAMVPTATCVVHVVDEQGRPVAEASVVFSPNYRINGGAQILAGFGISSEDSLRDKAKYPMERWRNTPPPYLATTNADGVAVVKGLPGWKQIFDVSSREYELPAVPGPGNLRRRYATAELTSGKTTAVTVTVQAKGKDSLADPLRPGEKSPVPQPVPKPAASKDLVYCNEDPAVRTDYVGKSVPDSDRTEFHGRVVDEAGKPIEGVLVDAWTWYKGNETRSDLDGCFQLKKLDRDHRIEVRFSKDGYTPRYIVQQPTGVQDAVVVLGTKTYFEGTVRDAKGQPVADAHVRVTPPAKQADGVMITSVWTEARTDESGRYRLYAPADVYEFQVKAPAGIARVIGVSLDKDEAKKVDIPLEAGLTFRAKVVDSQTGEPVYSVRLSNWEHREIKAKSGEDGLIEIPGMMPGKFEFQVEAKGYGRWWSAQCINEWQRFQKEFRPGSKWQDNFDDLAFDIQPDMEPVTIEMEKAVRIRGKVVDPEGHSVAGATVAPAKTGSGNSLTGDTRFSVTTGTDGTFLMFLPASKEHDYNLVAHDGKYEQWRRWANGVNQPFRTKPGDQIDDVVLTLTEPATVQGKVVDEEGKPVVDREVRASAFDKFENRYYDPTTRTTMDGTFELKFIRPTRQYIQVAPFWLQAQEAPKGTSAEVALEAGQVHEGVNLTAAEQRR